MLTHIVFGAGTVVALAQGVPFELRLLLAVLFSLLVNPVIDGLGHTQHGSSSPGPPSPTRSFTAPIWGGAIGYVVWVVGSSVGVADAGLETVLVVFGAVVAWARLFLDSMTERGVYFVTRRFALAHFGSGNLILNGIFVVGGLILIVL